MANGYNTSANQTKNKAYNYNPNQSPNLVLEGYASTYNYVDLYDGQTMETSAEETKNSERSSYGGAWSLNMGVNYNYTLYIKSINESDKSFRLNSRNGSDGFFLPLKSISYVPVKLNHLKIKAGIFNDLPFFHRRSMGTIQCVMHDSDKSYVSTQLLAWYSKCVNTVDSCVPYVIDMCREAEYTEYTHDGKVAVQHKFVVIPDNDLSINRDYDGGDGQLTEYKFSLIIVSKLMVGGGVATGGEWREADWGVGEGPAAQYERRTEATMINYDGNGGTYTYREPQIADYYGKR